MSYFSSFPKLLYSFDLKNMSPDVVTNIFTRIRLRSDVVKNSLAYYKYQLVDGDTPEIVAYKEYGDAQYHWIICFANSIVDPQFDFPLQTMALENKIIKQYGYTTIDQAFAEIHHYELGVERTLTEVYGSSTISSNSYFVSANQYSYASNTLDPIILNSPTTVTAQFRANNSNANSAVTSTLSVKSTYKSVSVYDYETSQNENKRQINLLKPSFIPAIIQEMQYILNG